MLLVYNVSKSSNVGPLIRSAVAFGCSAVVVVGGRRLSLHGNQLTARFLPFFHYPDIRTACAHIKAQGFELLGIEIGEGAEEVSQCRFPTRCCLIPGNEGSGLNETVRPLIDRLVYIRQSGAGTASLNVASASAIVMYSFQQSAHFPEQEREGGKFHVDAEKATQGGQRGTFRAPRTATTAAAAGGGGGGGGGRGGGETGGDDSPSEHHGARREELGSLERRPPPVTVDMSPHSAAQAIGDATASLTCSAGACAVLLRAAAEAST